MRNNVTAPGKKVTCETILRSHPRYSRTVMSSKSHITRAAHMPPSAAVFRPDGDTLIADWVTVADNNTYIDAPFATPIATTLDLMCTVGVKPTPCQLVRKLPTPEMAF